MLNWISLIHSVQSLNIVMGKGSVFKWNCAIIDTFKKLGIAEDNPPKDWKIDGRQAWKSIILQLLMTS